jgi:hypothetical protein
MCKIKKIILFTIITVIFSSLTVLASEAITPVSELIDRGREYNSKVVNIQGEAIGELLERGEYSFVNINDGTSAMGIYLKTTDGDMIKYYGDYHNIGDSVRVTGVFNRACKEHGGDMDIHCDSIAVVSNGYERTHDILRWKINFIVILTPFVIYGLIKVYGIIRKKS